MQNLHPEIPFVICSGRDSPEVRAEAQAAGARAWVPKTEIQRLVPVVNQVCGQNQKARRVRPGVIVIMLQLNLHHYRSGNPLGNSLVVRTDHSLSRRKSSRVW